MYVKPAPDRLIYRPDTLTPLKVEGEHVPDHDLFWTRAVRDGDVLKTDPPEETRP